MNKMRYIHIFSHKKIFWSTDTCYNIHEPWKKITLTETSQAQKNTLTQNTQIGKSIQKEGTIDGHWGVNANSQRVYFWGDKNVLELGTDDYCTTLWMCLQPLNNTLQKCEF
jgi:hypothetical protein